MLASWAGARASSFFFSSRRRHTRLQGDWSSDVCSSDLLDLGSYRTVAIGVAPRHRVRRFAKASVVSLGDNIPREDRKSTRLNSSHLVISYAVFCLKKKKINKIQLNNTMSSIKHEQI